MKKILLIIFIGFTLSIYSQKYRGKRDFVNFEKGYNKVQAGAGFDFAFSGTNKQGPMYYYIGNPSDINILNYKGLNGFGLSGNIEFTNENSILGLFLELNYTTKKYMHIRNGVNDTIQNNTLDIPLYLKFKFGKLLKYNYFYTAVGIGYAIPLKSRIYNNLGIENLDLNKVKTYPYASIIIGYEVLFGSDRDDPRFLFFLKSDIDLSTHVNNNYIYQKPYTTSFDSNTNYDIRFVRFNLGMRFMLRFKNAANGIWDAYKESLKK